MVGIIEDVVVKVEQFVVEVVQGSVMVEKFKFNLVLLEYLFVFDDVDMVMFFGSEGEMGVFVNYVLLMLILKFGFLFVSNDDIEIKYYVFGGFVEINFEGLIVLVEYVGEVDGVQCFDFDQYIKVVE